MSDQPAILIYVLQQHVSCLIPKRRGAGYLRTPLGHHANAELAQIATDLGFDLWGLDGALDVQTGYGGQAHVEAIGAALSAHYQRPWRQVAYDEYWAAHPI